jgi:alkylation response protein AidB-like acyl-CoA dehydrogenase
LVVGDLEVYGKDMSLIEKTPPFGDPAWLQGIPNPYFNESHRKFQKAVRAWVEKDLMPHIHEWETTRKPDPTIQKKCFDAGILPGIVGKWPVEYVGDKIAGGITPNDWDQFHTMILTDEICRTGSGGIYTFLIGGIGIGIGPCYHFGSKYIKDKVIRPCLTGERLISLAITEPTVGSDVANLKTSAKKTPCGKYWIVNGEKKWISTAIFSDFHTTAARTGGPGMGGISLLLIEKDMPGVKVRQMNCSGMSGSGTTYLTFEDVQVPVENLIGKEGKGFSHIVYNFNTERWGMVVTTIRFARTCLEEAYRYAHKRKTFGQRLIESPVIRAKIGNMIRQVEATQALLEMTTYSMKTMSHEEAMIKLAGYIAFLKVQATEVFEYCARESVQIFGGLGFTKGGQGEKVERLYRDVRAMSILGGSAEIMLDLGVRQSLKSKF